MKKTIKRRPGGQPKDNPASEATYLRHTPDQKALWKQAADEKGLPMATWIKSVLDASAKRAIIKKQ